MSMRAIARASRPAGSPRSEEHTSELQSLMRNSYDVFCLKKKKKINLQKEAKNIVMRNKERSNIKKTKLITEYVDTQLLPIKDDRIKPSMQHINKRTYMIIRREKQNRESHCVRMCN